ncbi:MAG: hypothetical protein WD314_02815 [Trueperaceae bacterium]
MIFEANSFDSSDTNLTVSVTPLDPTKESSALPGQLVTDDALLTPLTFAEFSIFDSNGVRVNLKSGASAVVELPIPPELRALPQYQDGSVIHCYSFNPETGQWEDFVVGIITTSSVDGTTPVVRASIKHFSWYGAAPESNDCADVYGQVVSAVDASPLPYARVEAFPGGETIADANGNFVLIAPRAGPNEFVATRTYTDSDGSVSGMPGAKAIEFGKIKDAPLTGLVSKPCNGSSGQSIASIGEPSDRLVIAIGNIGTLTYHVDAYSFAEATSSEALRAAGLAVPQGLDRFRPLAAGTVYAFLSEFLPDGASGDGLEGAAVTLAGPGGNVTLVDSGGGTYYANTDITAGSSYTLSIDAEGNGSVDGTGSVFAVGDVSWVNPTEGETLPSDGFVAEWSDTGAQSNDAYSALYFAWLNNDASDPNLYDGDLYIGTRRQFTPRSSHGEGTDQPLKPGHYLGLLWGFSGPYSPDFGDADYTATNNITGVTVNGSFYSYSFSSDTTIEFDLQ